MGKQADGIRYWGRPEAAETLGWHAARRRRLATTVRGRVAGATGAGLAVSQPAMGTIMVPGALGASPTGDPAATPSSEAALSTCVSVGVNLPVGRYPAEGVAESRVVRLFRADRDGSARVLVPQTFVLAATPGPDGSVNLSVLVRSAPGQGDRQVEEINGANAEQSLSAAVLYDVDNVAVLDDCRGR